MGWKEKGIEDARKGNDYKEPSRDVVDRIAGFTSKDEKEWKEDYKWGYGIGTSQRSSDTSSESDSGSSSSSSSSGGSGK